MKKLISLILAVCCMMAMASIGFAEAADTASAFTMYYPAHLQEQFGETTQLDKVPERIVCLSNTALQVLARLDIHPVAITSNATSGLPDWVYELPTISVGMKSLDVESIISYEPDLVILGSYQKEAYGQNFEDAGIDCFYTSEGPSISYSQTKDETLCLAKSFGGDEFEAELASEFEAVEQRCADFTATHETQTMMIFFYQPGTYQQTSKGYLGSMLAMLPFENLTDSLVDGDSPTTTIDTEITLGLNPDIIFAISPSAPSAEVLQETFEATFDENRTLWNQLDAVANNNIVYLGGEYVTSKGLQTVSSINALIDLLEDRIPAAN